MSAVKLCKDCKHAERTPDGALKSMPYCYKEPLGVSLLNGADQYGFCESLRMQKDKCGEEGIWFEPKEAA